MEKLDFLDYFKGLEDPRIERNKLYDIEEILLLTLCGVICGCEGWEDIEDFGESKLLFLRNYLPYKHGIPSDDTLRRFFRAIDPDAFQKCFSEWVASLHILTDNSLIAIDGKTSRRSFDADKNPLHLVSAFAAEARIVLGQEKVSEKSNEITAIPKLLDLLDIKRATVSIDAMGTQKKIAEKIKDRQGEYLLALKGNQGSLHDDIKLFFSDKELTAQISSYAETDGGHGRIEVRKCTVTDKIDWLNDRHDWCGLKSVVKIESQVEAKDKIAEETRYYITSLAAEPQKILNSVRSHWAIENSLHWVLDVSFNDDQSRIRKGNAPQNIAIIRHLSLNMLRSVQKKRQPIKGLRKKAGWDNDTLKEILALNFI